MSNGKTLGKLIFAKLDPFFFGNRKIMRAGRNGRDVFLFALCMNAQRGALGTIPAADLEPWYVSRQLDIPIEDAEDGVTKAVTAGLLYLDGEAVQIVGWNGDWARRPLSRAEIQANYRKRNKNANGGDTEEGDESYQDEVTSDDQSNALPIRGEERRSERDRGNAVDSLSLPDDFAPSQRARAIAQERNLDLVFELAQFRDTVSAKGWRVRDWEASFCKWLRQSKDVDRASSSRARPKVKLSRGPYVTKQRNSDGSERFELHDSDGNISEITAEEAAKYEKGSK